MLSSLFLLLMEVGSLPPALPCVPCTALRLLSTVPNTQLLCPAFQAGCTFSLEQGCATRLFQNVPVILQLCLVFLPV